MTDSRQFTSQTHPIMIASLQVPNAAGLLGLTFCPGKRDPHAFSGAWARDLDTDLAAVRAWGASALVTLVEDHELELLQVPQIGTRCGAHGMDWYHLPVEDTGVPDARFEQAWSEGHGPALRQRLANGQHLVLHCRGGLGRTGTIAARLLVEFGTPPRAAIDQVRAARPGAIENRLQERYVLALKP